MRNEEWGKRIRQLLEDHGLSYRGAAMKAGRPALRSYIGDWCNGYVPLYETALDVLCTFPRAEAIECLEAAGFDVPTSWMDDTDLADAVRRVVENRDDLTDEDKGKLILYAERLAQKKHKTEK